MAIRDSEATVTHVLPPGVTATSPTKVYALTATASYKALGTDFATPGYLGKWIRLKATGGTVWIRFATAGSGQDAAASTDNSWPLPDGDSESFYIALDSAITHLVIIAADTTPKLSVMVASPLAADSK